MKKAELGDYFMWHGQMVKVEWINTGQKAIGFTYKEPTVCPHCGGVHEITQNASIIEQSPLFQENATAIKTIDNLKP